MRQLRRPNVTVPTMGPNGAAARKRAEHIAEYTANGNLPRTFPEHWTSSEVRGALIAMQGRVCAYCGADLTEGGYDVEHFRPRKIARDPLGGYWWLAYDFGNYLLSCKPCNQERKGSRFPIAGKRCRYDDREEVQQEKRTLLDPTVDPVEQWLEVNLESPLLKIVPRPGIGPELTERVLETVTFFRLNLEVGHIKGRMAVLYRIVEELDTDRTEEVRRLAIRYRPHSLVALSVLAAKSQQDLPTIEDEIQWLIDDLSGDLKTHRSDDADDLKLRQADELLWALAVLWKDPPNGSPERVSQMLEDCGVREAVSEYVARL
jgi:uncharacterized protein (TIGR02646 family)